jgi:hypothetical protein
MVSTHYFFSNGAYLMPITRRRRANPPEQPENNNNHISEQPQENGTESLAAERSPESSQTQLQNAETQAPPLPTQENASLQPASASQDVEPAQNALTNQELASTSSAGPASQPFRGTENTYNVHAPQTATPSAMRVPPTPPFPALQVSPTSHAYQNGERGERYERPERQEYPPSLENNRRTARGELFRRPPTPPVAQPAPMNAAPPLQAPSHEITLPMGQLLHLAYNPGYTGSDEARSALLQKLSQESKAGGRARCWSCGSLAIVYDRWNTRSKTFGEIGIAFCEICGVWSVM